MHGPSLPSTALLARYGAGSARAQDMVDPRASARSGLPACRGRVERFTLAPGEKVGGMPLADRTEVGAPPQPSP